MSEIRNIVILAIIYDFDQERSFSETQYFAAPTFHDHLYQLCVAIHIYLRIDDGDKL